MTLYRVYKHRCRFKHNVEDAPWLKDRSCLTPHQHGFDPNPLCNLEFIVATEDIIDFKTIKEIGTRCVNNLANEIIEKEVEDKDGKLITSWFYDFGTMTTEQMIDDLKKLVLVELAKYHPIRVQIWLDETRKYSVWDDGA